jgi:putative transposase
MDTVQVDPRIGKSRFGVVADAFLDQEGLPFSSVLPAQDIEQAFARRDAMFGLSDIYSTPVVLWTFMAQALRDGKGASCAAAVADIAQYKHHKGEPVPSGDTGDYCRARAKLDIGALRSLARQAADAMEKAAPQAWLWHGMHAKLVDGFTFTMLDTPNNQRAFPQSKGQRAGVGLPIARACAVLSLATAAIVDLAVGPCKGKRTGETALLRRLYGAFRPGDLAIVDRYFCSYMNMAEFRLRDVHVCARLHQKRLSDFRRGKRLGKDDHLVTWTRPARPEWMSPREYARIPPTMMLRELRFTISTPGCRSRTITVVTTLLDPVLYPKDEIAQLFGFRWNVELDIRHVKQTLHLDHVSCKSPAMVQRHLWVTLLAYNLIRKVIAAAAVLHDKHPRQLGFTLACQEILTSWMILAVDPGRDLVGHWNFVLKRIAANEVANRPGRVEPRVLKRRRHHYPLMRRPRQQLRDELLPTHPTSEP